MVTTVELETKEWGGISRVSLSEGNTVYFSGFDKEEAGRRGLVYKTLFERCDGCEIMEPGKIPVEVACKGRAAIAAYLFSAHERSIKSIADQLDVSPTTVDQYLSDFRHGRR